MSRNKTDTIAGLITGLVAERAMTGFEIARALESRYRVPVRGREGAVYAALVQLERDGWIEAEADRTGRRHYALPVLRDESDDPGEDG